MCLVLAQAPAEAQDGVLLQGADRRLPAQGDRYLVRLQENWSATTQRSAEGQEPIEFTRETRLQAFFTLEALEVSKTRVEVWTLTFSLWKWQRGKQTLTDLKDLNLVLKRKAKDGGFVLDPPEAGKSFSQPAREFVARQARSLSRPDLSAFLPARAVRAGETWKVDPRLAAALLLEDGKPRKTSKVEGKLVSLTDEGAELRVKADLDLSRLPGTDAPSKGGKWQVDTTYRWPHGFPREATGVERRVRFSGEGRNQSPDGQPYGLKLTVQGRLRVRVTPAGK